MKVSVKIQGAAQLSRDLAAMEAKLQRKVGRGAVGKMANEVRDEAKKIASAQGLDKKGPGVLPSGRPYRFRGRIYDAISARVLRKTGSKFNAVAYVRSQKGKSGVTAPHWIWLEFGSIHNEPKPFFRAAVMSAGERAINAGIRYLEKWIDKANGGRV